MKDGAKQNEIRTGAKSRRRMGDGLWPRSYTNTVSHFAQQNETPSWKKREDETTDVVGTMPRYVYRREECAALEA